MDNKFSAEDEILGSSLINLKEMVKEFASSGDNVLFLGDRGTGKELFAKLYHQVTGRDSKKFIALNCSGVSEEILQSELFGHVKGAYTGAHTDRPGLITTYGEEGVIFLDELGDASPSFQATLLRLLETGDYKKLGSDKKKFLDPKKQRIIAATSKKDKVRDDLKDRFIPLYIMELTTRPGDIPELIKKFCNTSNVERMTRSAFRLLINYKWPGNIRELKRVIEKEAIKLCEKRGDNTITINDIPSIEFSHEERADNSDAIKIEDLPLHNEVYPRRHFMRYLTATEPDKTDDQTFRETIISRLDNLAFIGNTLRQISGKLKEPSQQEQLTQMFDNTTPDEYKEQFYKHQLKQGRKNKEVINHYDLGDGIEKRGLSYDKIKRGREKAKGDAKMR